MRDFFITTDSNSDLPQEYIEKLGTVIIPQYYSFGDIVYGDELHIPPAEFYERMRNGELPQSQANNPAVIEEKFRAILDQGCDIIHIAFSSALSGSYNNVCMVTRELLEEYTDARITVIDSLNVSLGEALLLIHANHLKQNGASYDEIVIAIETMKNHINVQFTVDDLFHLQRSCQQDNRCSWQRPELKALPQYHRRGYLDLQRHRPRQKEVFAHPRRAYEGYPGRRR